MDTTVRDPEEASRYLGTDVIGILPAVHKSEQLVRVPEPETDSASALAKTTPANGNGVGSTDYRKGYYRTISGFGEAIRTLRNTIALADIHSRLRSIVVTSASPAEGKTTVAVHLAVASAMQGTKTLLIDGDLRRPSVHGKFGLPPADVGFNDVLTSGADWRKALIVFEGRPNLALLPAGRTSHRAADLIGPRMNDLLDDFAQDYDLVIFDSPPLLGFAESLQMATAADGVLVICRAGETRRKSVGSVLGVLKRIRANVVGVVLNQVRRDTTADGYYYYGYYTQGYYYNRQGD
jgi:capsular exopolysaccharide synthesis family protein